MTDLPDLTVDSTGVGTGRGFKPPASSDRLYRYVLWTVAVAMGLLLILFVESIAQHSVPGWKAAGWKFFTSDQWNFGAGQFGALPLIMGTLITTALAVLVATPIAIASALAIVFIVPRRMKILVSSVVELLAVVPSIIYGVWGVFVMASWLGAHGQPWLQRLFHGNWPFSGVPVGFGIMLGSVVLAVMILPTITAISRDVIALVPQDLIEGALSLGATRGQVLRKVVLPSAKTGIFGAVVLGVGRALGETVAMVFLLGGVTSFSPYPKSLLSTGATLASEVANSLQEAVGQGTLTGVLCCLALVLMVIVGAVNLSARLVIRRGERKLR